MSPQQRMTKKYKHPPIIESVIRKFDVAEDAAYHDLNKINVDIASMRVFLAGLTNDGFDTIPLGDLLQVIQALHRAGKSEERESRRGVRAAP